MITVAGTVIGDIFVRTLEQEPARGSLTVVNQVGFHLGGAAPNTGAVLSRLGVPVSVVGRIGTDPFGQLVRQQIEKWASHVTLAVDEFLQTTACVGHIFADGERSFLYAGGASAGFRSADLDLKKQCALGSRALHVGYALLLPKLDGEPMRALLEDAQALQMLVSLDVAYYPGPDWKSLTRLMPYVDVFCPNAREAEAITGEQDPAVAAARLLKDGVRRFVAVTLGEQGAYVRTADGPGEYIPACSVRTIDSTGAGDAFIGGILAAWHRKLDWRQAGRIANAAGALATTKQGATEGLETWEQTVRLAERGGSKKAEGEAKREEGSDILIPWN
jgi:sugar/nucleoside kinase (ribokinase family)